MRKNWLWLFLGEYWNKWNCTCLICSWCTWWSLIIISRFLTPSKTSQKSSLKSHFNIHRETVKVDVCPYFSYICSAPQRHRKHGVWVTCGKTHPLQSGRLTGLHLKGFGGSETMMSSPLRSIHEVPRGTILSPQLFCVYTSVRGWCNL